MTTQLHVTRRNRRAIYRCMTTMTGWSGAIPDNVKASVLDAVEWAVTARQGAANDAYALDLAATSRRTITILERA